MERQDLSPRAGVRHFAADSKSTGFAPHLRLRLPRAMRSPKLLSAFAPLEKALFFQLGHHAHVDEFGRLATAQLRHGRREIPDIGIERGGERARIAGLGSEKIALPVKRLDELRVRLFQ